MKTNLFKNTVMMLVATFMLLNTAPANAQQKVADKELIGVWYMESCQFEGEKKMESKITGYTNMKVYRPNGEYACVQVIRQKDGKYQFIPHEYGTYTFKDGKYTEMGRDGIQILVDPTTFKGQWKNRHDVWKKVVNCPKKLENHIVNLCKTNLQPDDEIRQIMSQHVF